MANYSSLMKSFKFMIILAACIKIRPEKEMVLTPLDSNPNCFLAEQEDKQQRAKKAKSLQQIQCCES